MINAVIITLAVLSNLFWLFLAYVLPFVYVLKTGRYFKGVLISWGLNLLFSFVICLFIPGVISFFLPDHELKIFDSFPEAKAIVAILVIGWLPAVMCCTIAFGIRCWLKDRSRSKSTDDSHPDS